MNKTLVLLRHAHRDKDLGSETDNGLSRKGQQQAKTIEKHFHKVFDGEKPLVLSSPKRRCIETVLPLVDGSEKKITIDPLLDEGNKLKERAKTFIQWWESNGPLLTVACSHGDWLPICIEILTGARIEMKKGCWAEVQVVDGQARLTWLLQEL